MELVSRPEWNKYRVIISSPVFQSILTTIVSSMPPPPPTRKKKTDFPIFGGRGGVRMIHPKTPRGYHYSEGTQWRIWSSAGGQTTSHHWRNPIGLVRGFSGKFRKKFFGGLTTPPPFSPIRSFNPMWINKPKNGIPNWLMLSRALQFWKWLIFSWFF